MDLIKLISEHQLEHLSSEILGLAKEAIGISTTLEEDSNITVGNSKFGGSPNLPTTLSWPTTNIGIPYIFLCQLNLADLAEFPSEEDIPSNGRLYFFFSHSEMDDTRVIFSDAPTSELTRCSFPEIDEEILEFEEAPEVSEYHASSISFYSKLSLPHLQDLPTNLSLSEAEQTSYASLLESLNGDRLLHQFFGYCHPIQSGVIVENKLLLQIDEDEKLGLEWGDGGMAYFSGKSFEFSSQGASKINGYWESH